MLCELLYISQESFGFWLNSSNKICWKYFMGGMSNKICEELFLVSRDISEKYVSTSLVRICENIPWETMGWYGINRGNLFGKSLVENPRRNISQHILQEKAGKSCPKWLKVSLFFICKRHFQNKCCVSGDICQNVVLAFGRDGETSSKKFRETKSSWEISPRGFSTRDLPNRFPLRNALIPYYPIVSSTMFFECKPNMLKHILRRYLHKQFWNMVLESIDIYIRFLGLSWRGIYRNLFPANLVGNISGNLQETLGRYAANKIPNILQHLLGSNALFKSMLNTFLNVIGRYSGKKKLCWRVVWWLLLGDVSQNVFLRETSGKFVPKCVLIFFRHTGIPRKKHVQNKCCVLDDISQIYIILAFGRDIS